jgi:hypothetical protein
MDASNRDDYSWLLSEAATPLLRLATDVVRTKGNMVGLAKALRKEISRSRAAIVIEQAQLRLRARSKFPNAGEMFFTKRGLEQATGRGIALYKAARFASCENVADICCGVGGDLLALHDRSDCGNFNTTGVDADELTALFASHNLKVGCTNQAGRTEVLFQKFESMSMDGLDGLHADPDRRGSASNFQRTVHGSRFEPSLDQLLHGSNNIKLAAIKVAPATPVSDAWPQQIEREWIGDRHECKQQLIWRGEQADRVGHRIATCVDDVGGAASFSIPEASVDIKLPAADSVGAYVHEPHPTVLAAEISQAFGQQLDLRPLTKDVAYLTGEIADHPLLQSFQVIEILSLNLKKVAAALKAMDVGILEVKRRGVEQAAGDPFLKLKLSGSQPATVILTRFDGKRVAIIARRVSGYANKTDGQ